ncbi:MULTISPECIES: PQQ-binding-like beta-propeller repeat protein [unclassified Spirillospora]|uniref:outer membrane protein assembly factor BamB family protein n=1 Tax=unclassified Spirillospora TaxID=2642701 RepID=UPI00371CE667
MDEPGNPARRFGRRSALLAVLASLLPVAACGIGEEAVLWSLEGRAVGGGEPVTPTVWATGPTLAMARARDVTGYDPATGEPRWTVPLPDKVCAVSSRPSGGRVAVRFGKRELGCNRVAVIDVKTGTKVWEQAISPTDRHWSGEIVIGEGVVVADWRYSTAAFRLDDGRPLWTIDSRGADCAIDGLSGGPVLLARQTCENKSRSVHRLDPRSGRYRWSHDVPPAYKVEAMASTRHVVLGLRSTGRGVSRFAVLDPSGRQVAGLDIAGGEEARCHDGRQDLNRCVGVVVADDSLYVRSGERPAKRNGRTVPIVSYDLATGRARWATDNPDRNHLYPLAIDGDRLIAAQPRKPGAGGKGGGGSEPPRLVSVDAATGRTSIMWRLPSDVGLWLRSRYGRQYAQGRLFMNETSVTRGEKDDIVFRAFAKPPE